jgi:hypothetical protein
MSKIGCVDCEILKFAFDTAIAKNKRLTKISGFTVFQGCHPSVFSAFVPDFPTKSSSESHWKFSFNNTECRDEDQLQKY